MFYDELALTVILGIFNIANITFFVHLQTIMQTNRFDLI